MLITDIEIPTPKMSCIEWRCLSLNLFEWLLCFWTLFRLETKEIQLLLMFRGIVMLISVCANSRHATMSIVEGILHFFFLLQKTRLNSNELDVLVSNVHKSSHLCCRLLAWWFAVMAPFECVAVQLRFILYNRLNPQKKRTIYVYWKLRIFWANDELLTNDCV